MKRKSIKSANHALLVGNVLGMFNKYMPDTDCMPIMEEDGFYSNSLLIKRGDTEYIVTVTPME